MCNKNSKSMIMIVLYVSTFFYDSLFSKTSTIGWTIQQWYCITTFVYRSSKNTRYTRLTIYKQSDAEKFTVKTVNNKLICLVPLEFTGDMTFT